MWFTKLMVDIVVAGVVCSAIPKLAGTLVEVLKKFANGLNDFLRKAFKLDEVKNEGN